MQFTIEQRFAGPLADVEAAFLDPAFLERLSELPKLGGPKLLRQEVDGDRVHQAVHYHFVGDVSPAVRRVVDPSRLTWVEESTWDRRTHQATWTIVPDHYRHLLRASGTFTLEVPQPPGIASSGTSRRAQGELQVTLPLVGGKVERAIVRGLQDHAALEVQVLDDWLSAPS